jgi:hypothetical protein
VITWWVTTYYNGPPAHAVEGDNERAVCGFLPKTGWRHAVEWDTYPRCGHCKARLVKQQESVKMSWAPEVKTINDDNSYGNALRFATREEAEKNVADLRSRWLLVTETRVVESDDPVNYKWTETGLVAVEKEKT